MNVLIIAAFTAAACAATHYWSYRQGKGEVLKRVHDAGVSPIMALLEGGAKIEVSIKEVKPHKLFGTLEQVWCPEHDGINFEKAAREYVEKELNGTFEVRRG